MRADPCTSDHQEDNTTLDMMRERGIDNVRGGVFCQPQLTPADERAAKKSIAGMRGACIRCFRTSHLANKCFAKTDAYGCDLQPDGGGAAKRSSFSFWRKEETAEDDTEDNTEDSDDTEDNTEDSDDTEDDSDEDSDYERSKRRRRE